MSVFMWLVTPSNRHGTKKDASYASKRSVFARHSVKSKVEEGYHHMLNQSMSCCCCWIDVAATRDLPRMRKRSPIEARSFPWINNPIIVVGIKYASVSWLTRQAVLCNCKIESCSCNAMTMRL